jgi:hypothetical protein
LHRVAGGANYEIPNLVASLRLWFVDLSEWLTFEPATACILNQSDDGQPIVVAPTRIEAPQSLPDGIFARPVPLRERFVTIAAKGKSARSVASK